MKFCSIENKVKSRLFFLDTSVIKQFFRRVLINNQHIGILAFERTMNSGFFRLPPATRIDRSFPSSQPIQCRSSANR